MRYAPLAACVVTNVTRDSCSHHFLPTPSSLVFAIPSSGRLRGLRSVEKRAVRRGRAVPDPWTNVSLLAWLALAVAERVVPEPASRFAMRAKPPPLHPSPPTLHYAPPRNPRRRWPGRLMLSRPYSLVLVLFAC